MLLAQGEIFHFLTVGSVNGGKQTQSLDPELSGVNIS